jgi:RimJ/RimL family protein N-acetyltransferase
MRLESDRFILRPIEIPDISDSYIDWFDDDDVKKYIAFNSREDIRDSLEKYILKYLKKDNALFLGIFDKISGLHIGNLKYEPICKKEHYAVLGILIGDKNYRGKGVAAEVIKESGIWLKINMGIRKVTLGVDKSNTPAIRAYKKCGFISGNHHSVEFDSSVSMAMIWDI